MVPCRWTAACVATPVVTGNQILLGQVLVVDKQSDCVQLCDTSWFCMLKERVCTPGLPNTSLANTDKLMEPVLNVVVEGQYTVHAGVAILLFRVPVVVDTLIRGCRNLVPLLMRSTWWTPESSVGTACTVTNPETVAPSAGEVRLAAGAVLSERIAMDTALAALTTPNPRSGVQLAPSPAVASMIPLTCTGVRVGFLDRTSPAIPATAGVAMDVPLSAS